MMYYDSIYKVMSKIDDEKSLGDEIHNLIAKYNTFAELEPTATDIGKINPYIK